MSLLASSRHDVPAAPGWLARAEAWLDDKGKGGWIAAMVAGFILFWPVGLAVLAYMIWSKKMSCSAKHTPRRGHGRLQMSRATGNAAFDAYKAETLDRLEREQENFEAFLQRLRAARDKAEFDQFMEERARTAGADPDSDANSAAPARGRPDEA